MPQAIAWLLLALLMSGCIKRSVCELDASACSLAVKLLSVPEGSLFADQTSVVLQVTGRTYEEDLRVYLDQDTVSLDLSQSISGPSGTSNLYDIRLQPGDLRRFRSGPLFLTVAEGPRQAPKLPLRLLGKIPYTNLPFSTSIQGSYPSTEYLDFINTRLIALRSGLDGSSNPAKIIRRYAWMNDKLDSAEITGDYFNFTLFGGKSLASASASSVFLLRAVMTTDLELRTCDVSPGNGSSCTVYSPRLPLDTQAFAVSTDGTLGVVADKNGALSSARLDQGTSLNWQSVGTPSASSAVKLALGDVNGDGMVDVIRVGSVPGSAEATVLLGSGSTFMPDEGLSTALKIHVGTAAVDALAVGDLDQDGRAEVLLGSGQTVRVLFNFWDTFVQVTKFTLDTTQAGPKVTAIGIGKLDGTIDATKLLDIVVASNSLPDLNGNGTLFLQAFRDR